MSFYKLGAMFSIVAVCLRLHNTLQHAATCYNMLQRSAMCCNVLQRAATCCNMLHRAATCCIVLQHAAWGAMFCIVAVYLRLHNTLHHTATHCTSNTRQPTATHWKTLQHTALGAMFSIDAV